LNTLTREQAEIRQERREIELEIKTAEAIVKLAKQKLADLKKRCRHPNIEVLHDYSVCPDCRYSDQDIWEEEE